MAIRSALIEDIDAIRALLSAADLPTSDVLPASRIEFFVYEGSGSVPTGCVGLETYREVGLLRSLAVAPVDRHAGIGRALVRTVEAAATSRGLRGLYLLTTTATQFFLRNGYQLIERSSAPLEVRESTQFAQLCPVTAVCMGKSVGS